MIQGDRRKSRRFSLSLPVVVRWTEASLCGEAQSETRDVSSHGLRFVLPKRLAIGSLVQILMTLPREVIGVRKVVVDFQACVVRSSTDSDRVEVAAEIQTFTLMRDSENVEESH